MLVNELSSMVTTNNRKMDKSTVLKSTISFLKNHNEIAVRSRAHEIQEDWKPSFLSNEEFTHLILEGLDGFIMVFSSSGRIFYASESITSLLGHLPNDLQNMTIYDLVHEEDQSELYNVLLNPSNSAYQMHYDETKENQVSFSCHLKRGGLDFREEPTYDLVHFVGYFRLDVEPSEGDNYISSTSRYGGFAEPDNSLLFVGTGRLHTPLLIREMSVVDSAKSEFTSRHSLEWKFLFLDHRAPPIIGYLPFEVLGTSGYDYYHVDDLEKVAICHEALMEKGEGTSCHYRFLTKGQQWIWLQTRFYITYHQWNSKPEFIVCTHRVVSYVEVMESRKDPEEPDRSRDDDLTRSDITGKQQCAVPSQSGIVSSPWPSVGRTSKFPPSRLVPSDIRGGRRRQSSQDPGSDTTSVSADSRVSKQSHLTTHSMLVRQPITITQTHIQDELQRKHEELQQLIVQQQEELRRVSEQLFMARYGLLPSLQLNGTLPYSVSGGTVSSTTSTLGPLVSATHTAPASPMYVGSPSAMAISTASCPAIQLSTVRADALQVNSQGHSSSEELIPFQLSQQQAQILFTSSNSNRHSH
uniref:PAS domain-containing protein n=1 Tax=Timema shepardi TaxID=629360 RepID=A0A7R9B259_TIMSH|nr:unnamed protein product [Timema shepardi]